MDEAVVEKSNKSWLHGSFPIIAGMRVHAKVCGYFDWVPCPPGTEITQADLDAKRVKQMTNDSWHMKVEIKADTHHDAGIPEDAIIRRMSALEKLGKQPSREEAVFEALRKSFEHHVDTKHLVKILVEDDGPQVEMYKLALTEMGVTDEAAVAAALERYEDSGDMETYLNTVFKTKASKTKTKPTPTPAKETP